MCKKSICLIASALCLGLALTASADLVALYEFEGNLRDTGGNRAGPFDATVFNGTPEVNADGKLVLTRSDQDAITLGTVVGSAPDLTFALWANSATESQFMRLLGKGDNNSSNPGWNVMIRPSGENNTFRPEWQGHGRGLWGNSVPVENAYVVGQWVHWAVTWDSASETMKIYVDGVLMETAVVAGADVANTADEMLVGRSGFGASEYFDGMVDDLAIWDEALTDDDVLAVFTLGPLALDPRMAVKPKPEDENGDVSRDVVLTWTPGQSAVSRNVFLGTRVEDVNSASVADPLGTIAGQDLTTAEWDPGRLEFGQTYYWRVDEVNGAPDFTTFKGTIWSFTAEPFSIPITGVTATASSAFGASTPERTVDGSGLVDDLHGITAGDMWISAGLPATIEYAFDRPYKLDELWIWNSNQVIEVFVGFGAKDVVIEHSLDGENWTVLEGVGPLAQAPGAEDYRHNNTIDFGGVTAQQVRLTVNSVHGIVPQASLSEVRFFLIPTYATGPNPAPGATNVAADTTLSWARDGREADRHEVSIGTDASDLALAGTVSESSLSTDALDLALGTTYTWRVDEVNETMDPSLWTGDLWSFTTVETITVDDMESYKDEEFLEIWATWIDGFDDPANGSLVGANPAIGDFSPETSIAQGGSQSLPIWFDNSTAAISEATRTFDSAMDWTGHGVGSLVLYLNRGAANTGGGQVYVKINDTKIVNDGGAGLPPGWDAWTQWTIDLSGVADAANVRSLTIGIEGAGASGVLYVDSIQLVENAPAAFQPLSWWEAESGALSAPMLVFSDNPTASAGQHIGTIDGIGDENGNPPADGLATYSFDVPEDGVYRLAVRVIITGGSNSFWFRIPGMATNTTNHASGWVRFNDIADGDAWHWDEVQSSDDGNSVVEFTLAAGTHTLEIARREDGTLLDAIALLK